MAEVTEKAKRGWEPPAYFHVTGLAVAIVALVITIFFSVRAEHNKALTLKYFGERPLLSLQNHTSAQLAIMLGAERLQSPWLFSGRIENTGDQPIEAKDVESPLQLSFDQGRVVGAEIVDKSQPAINAKATHDVNSVTISHTLLNPGDWIGFDILFDGQPARPNASARVSGVSTLLQISSPPGEKQGHPTLLNVSKPWTYFLVILGSVAAGVVLVFGFGLFGDVIKDIATSSAKAQTVWEENLAISQFLPRLEPTSNRLKMVFWLIGEQPTLDWLNYPSAIAETIRRLVPAAVIQSLSIDVNSAATGISLELKQSLRSFISSSVYRILPSGSDEKARQQISQIDLSKVSAAELIARAKEITEAAQAGRQSFFDRFDKTELMVGLITTIVGIVLVLVLGGTWRTVLGR